MKEKIKKQKGFIQILLLILIIGSLFFVIQPTQAGFFDWFSLSKVKSFFFREAVEEKLPTSVPESIKEIPSLQEAPQEIPEEITIQNLKNQIASLKNQIKSLEKQIEDLLSRSPGIKVVVKEVPVEKIVIKEVPVEKIVYREAECPSCNCPSALPIVSDVSYSKSGEVYKFRTSGEGFFIKEIIYCITGDGIYKRRIYYSLNGGEAQWLGGGGACQIAQCQNCYSDNFRPYYMESPTSLIPAIPKDSEIIIYREGVSPLRIEIIRFQGVETGKTISLP